MPSTAAVAVPITAPPARKPKRQWSPRLWEGTDCFSWLRMLAANNFAVQPSYWYIAGDRVGPTRC